MNAPPMSHVTCHVLDATTGTPAAGVGVRLSDLDGALLAEAVTDDDGRVDDLGPEELPLGDYALTFTTGAWFAAQGRDTFYPSVTVAFIVDGRHCHVPLLLSPYAYSTYRGS